MQKPPIVSQITGDWPSGGSINGIPINGNLPLIETGDLHYLLCHSAFSTRSKKMYTDQVRDLFHLMDEVGWTAGVTGNHEWDTLKTPVRMTMAASTWVPRNLFNEHGDHFPAFREVSNPTGYLLLVDDHDQHHSRSITVHHPQFNHKQVFSMQTDTVNPTSTVHHSLHTYEVNTY